VEVTSAQVELNSAHIIVSIRPAITFNELDFLTFGDYSCSALTAA